MDNQDKEPQLQTVDETKPKITPTERASLGGKKISEGEKGKAHMTEIGTKGGNAILAKYGVEYFRNLGKKGGYSRKVCK